MNVLWEKIYNGFNSKIWDPENRENTRLDRVPIRTTVSSLGLKLPFFRSRSASNLGLQGESGFGLFGLFGFSSLPSSLSHPVFLNTLRSASQDLVVASLKAKCTLN